MITTKEQERKAIEKIRKIIDELGENSYVGFAMDGVLELAEENIREDTAYSMKRRVEIAQERADEAKEENGKLKNELREQKECVQQQRETIEEKINTIRKLQKKLREASAAAKADEIPEELMKDLYCMAYDKEAEAQEKMERAADQMTEAILAGESTQGLAEEYRDQKANRSKYRRIMEMLEQRKRQRAEG